MAVLTYTFSDLKQGVYVLLQGQKYAETEAGTTAIKEQINRAQAEVLSFFGTLAFAGSLYASVPITQSGTAESFSFSANNVLLPIAAEVAESAGVYATAGYVLPDRYFRLGRTARASKEYQYTFIGTSVFVRPIVPLNGVVTVQYIGQPNAMSADGDVMQADPRLFRAVCLKAAKNIMEKLPGVAADKRAQVAQDLETEYQALNGVLMRAVKAEYEGRTGRDVDFEGRAPGQGG